MYDEEHGDPIVIESWWVLMRVDTLLQLDVMTERRGSEGIVARTYLGCTVIRDVTGTTQLEQCLLITTFTSQQAALLSAVVRVHTLIERQ